MKWFYWHFAKKSRLTYIIGLLFIFSIPNFCYGQDVSIEEEIEVLIKEAKNFNEIEKIIMLITWESPIIKNIPSISPVLPPDFRNIHISSAYGGRYHPVTGEYKHHSGIDLPCHMRDTIYAPATGLISETGYNSLLGNYIKIKHLYEFETVFGHLDEVLVEIGNVVIQGEQIALGGNTGRSTGSHLHYGIKKNGQDINAYPFCFLFLNYMLKSEKKGGN